MGKCYFALLVALVLVHSPFASRRAIEITTNTSQTNKNKKTNVVDTNKKHRLTPPPRATASRTGKTSSHFMEWVALPVFDGLLTGDIGSGSGIGGSAELSSLSDASGLVV